MNSQSMKRRKKRKRPFYGRIIISLLLFGTLLYFLIKVGIGLFIEQHSSYLVDYGSLDIKKEYSAIVIRNELVVNTQYAGSITYFVGEGETVAKGQQIAEIFNDGSVVATEDATEKEVVQKQVEFDYTVLESDIMNLKNKILFAIETEQFKTIPELKQALILKLETREKLEGENKFLANRTTSSSQKTVGQSHLKSGQKGIINSPADGFVSYMLDGYEDALTLDNIYNINYDEISDLAKTSLYTSQVTGGNQAIFKIIDESTIYLLVPVENSEVETYKDMNNLSVQIGEDVLEGQVFDVFSGTNEAMAVIKVFKPIARLIDNRKLSVTLIKDNYEGLKINVDSIVNLENQLGVYVVGQDNKLMFVPVKVLGYDDDYAIVKSNQYTDENNELIRSLKLNQEVVRNGKNYKVGDSLN